MLKSPGYNTMARVAHIQYRNSPHRWSNGADSERVGEMVVGPIGALVTSVGSVVWRWVPRKCCQMALRSRGSQKEVQNVRCERGSRTDAPSWVLEGLWVAGELGMFSIPFEYHVQVVQLDFAKECAPCSCMETELVMYRLWRGWDLI